MRTADLVGGPQRVADLGTHVPGSRRAEHRRTGSNGPAQAAPRSLFHPTKSTMRRKALNDEHNTFKQ